MIRVVFNQKGGVGKSTIAVNLAAIAAARGRRTLVVDLDESGNATRYLAGAGFDATGRSVADLFEESLALKLAQAPAAHYVHATRFAGLHLLPSGKGLAELHPRLESRMKTATLRKALAQLAPDFDEIWIDAPPALNFYTRSALLAAQGCLVPFDCDDFSRQALYGVIGAVQELRDDHNESLRLEGIVINQFLPRAAQPRRIVDELLAEGLPVLDARLSQSVKVRESHDAATPLVHLAPGHKLTLEFAALHDELQRRAALAAAA